MTALVVSMSPALGLDYDFDMQDASCSSESGDPTSTTNAATAWDEDDHNAAAPSEQEPQVVERPSKESLDADYVLISRQDSPNTMSDAPALLDQEQELTMAEDRQEASEDDPSCPMSSQDGLELSSKETTSHEEDMNTQEEGERPASPTPETSNLPGGLENLGNTCYMNSALQLLRATGYQPELSNVDSSGEDTSEKPALPSLQEALLEVLRATDRTLSPETWKRVLDERSDLFVGYEQQDAHEFLVTVLDLLDEDWKNEWKQAHRNVPAPKESDTSPKVTFKKQKTEETVQTPPPSSFMDLEFHDIESLLHGQTAAAEAAVAEQQQEHEYLAAGQAEESPHYKLVGGRMTSPDAKLSSARLQSSAEVPSTPIPSQSAWSPATPTEAVSAQPDEPENDTEAGAAPTLPASPVEEKFGLNVCVSLVCDSCKFTRSHTETYLHLSLEIGGDGTSDPPFSLEDGIRNFLAPEQRTLKCEKCFCATATMTNRITRFPESLLIHFKRFLVDVSPDYSSVTYRKNPVAVTLPAQLKLGEHGVDNEDESDHEATQDSDDFLLLKRPLHSYHATSMVHHIGSSAHCGHYTATSKHEESDGWRRFNDDYVTEISSEEALGESACSTTYMILYQQDQ